MIELIAVHEPKQSFNISGGTMNNYNNRMVTDYEKRSKLETILLPKLPEKPSVIKRIIAKLFNRKK